MGEHIQIVVKDVKTKLHSKDRSINICQPPTELSLHENSSQGQANPPIRNIFVDGKLWVGLHSKILWHPIL